MGVLTELRRYAADVLAPRATEKTAVASLL